MTMEPFFKSMKYLMIRLNMLAKESLGLQCADLLCFAAATGIMKVASLPSMLEPLVLLIVLS